MAGTELHAWGTGRMDGITHVGLDPRSAHEAMRDLAEALQAMRGVALVVAVTVVAEVGDFRRFANARRLMAYLGLLPQRALIREYNPTRRHH